MVNIYQVGTDLERFSAVIEELRYDYAHPELDTLIIEADPNISVSERFLIKMDIRRLAKPCTRLLDFRQLFSEACQEFIYHNQTHYLDKLSKEAFLKEVKRYGNVYTMGTYYFLSHLAKVALQNKATLVGQQPVPKIQVLSLTDFPIRKEQRAYYASKVEVLTTSPEHKTLTEIKHSTIAAITTDLSQSGVCIKAIKGSLSIDNESVYLWFRGLEEEYAFRNDLIIRYRIVSGKDKNNFTYYRLVLHDCQNQDTHTEFVSIIDQIIRVNQRRNKVPLDNVVASILAKGHEQYVINRMNTLPIAVGRLNQQWYPLCLFKNDASTPFYNYFEQQKNRNALADIFASKYIQDSLNLNKPCCRYFYFIQLSDKSKNIHFSLIPAQLLKNDVMARQMIAFAAARNKLTVLRFDAVSINSLKDSYVPSSLPDSTGEAFENLNRTVPESSLAILKQAERLCFITDVSDAFESFDFNNRIGQASRFSLTNFDINAGYRRFILAPAPNMPIKIKVTQAETNDFRAEDRFDYKMKISLYPKSAPRKTVNGITINMSTKGLHVLLDSALALKTGTIVMVNFVSLNTSSKLDLVHQPYKVVGQDGIQDFRLVIAGPPSNHLARQTLRSLIYKNIERLKVSGMSDDIYGLSRAVRNIIAANHTFAPVFLSRVNKRCVASAIAVNPNINLPPIKKGEQSFSAETLSGIIEQEFFQQRASLGIRNTNAEFPFDVWYLIIFPRNNEGVNKHCWLLRDADTLRNKGQLERYLNQVTQLNDVRIFRVETTKKGRIFNKYMRDEIQYLTQLRAEQSKKVLAQINDVIGLCNITDETELIVPLLALL